MNQTTAYMECYPNSTYDTARKGASAIMTKPDIGTEISRLKGLTEEGDVMTRKYKREVLKQDVVSRGIKYQDKHRAIALDNQMAGDNEPETVQHNIVIEWGKEQ